MAIKEYEGRAMSWRTPEEDLKFLKDAIDGLNPDEKAALDIMLAEMQSSGRSDLFDALGDVEYKHRPVDIETFVKDDYFLGKTCDNLRPKLLDDLKEMFESGYYNEIIYTGCVELDAIVQGADGSLRTLREWIGRSGKVIGFSNEGPRSARTGVAKHSGVQQVVELALANGMRVRLTPDHKVMVWRGDYVWVPAGELREGDLALYPRRISTDPSANLSETEAKLLAYWEGDGSSSHTRSRFCDGNLATCQEVVRLLEDLGFEGSLSEKGSNCWEVTVRRNVTDGFREWLVGNGYGGGTYTAHVPDVVARSNNKVVAAFLNRLWACEGTVYAPEKGAPVAAFSSVSEKFSRQVQLLLLRFGVRSDIRKLTSRRKGTESVSWQVTVTGRDNLVVFLDEIGPILGKESACERMRNRASGTKGNSNVDILPLKRKELSELMASNGLKRSARSKWWGLARGSGAYLSRSKFEEWLEEYGDTDLGRKLSSLFPETHGFSKVASVTPQAEPIEVGDVCDVEDLKSWISQGIQVHNSIGWGKCIDPSSEIVDAKKGRRLAGDHGEPWLVPSMDEATGKIAWKAASSFDSGEKSCVELKLKGGQRMTLSFDHPVFTSGGWKRAGDVTTSDLVATPRAAIPPPECIEISDDEVALTALLMADGGCTGPNTFTNESPELLEMFTQLVERLGDASSYDKWHRHVKVKTEVVEYANSGKATTLRASGIDPLVKKNGLDSLAKEKRLPASWYLLPNRQIAKFLNLFWACDGSVYTSSPLKVETTLASEGLVDDLKYLLSRLGVQARKAYTPKKLKGKQFPAWRLSITGARNILDFFERVGPIVTKEETSRIAVQRASEIKSNTNVDIVPIGYEELKEIRAELGEVRARGLGSMFQCPKGQRLSRAKFGELVETFGYEGKYAWLAKSDLLWERVESVADVGTRPVVDLSVPGTHNFVGNGIVVHNTFTASIAICRILYELSCMKDPHRAYGIAADSNISIVGLSVSEELATKVVFENIATKIDASPYFKEHFPYERTKKEMRFPGHIWVAARATTTNAALGLNVVAALIDEGNFMPKGNDPRFDAVDKAEILYNGLKRRLKSRFQELGRLPGAIFIISSKMTADDFTARRIKASTKDPHVFVRDYALWEVMPPGTYDGDVFWVLVGNEQTPSKILSPDEVDTFKEDKPEGCVLVEVPEDFRPEFEADLEGAIRDIAGIATVSVSPYIQRREKIDEAVDNREHPFSEISYDPSKGGRFLWDKMVRPRLERGEIPGIKEERLRPILNPDAPRHLHIDAALTNDSLGLAMAHVGGWKDVVRKNEDGEKFMERAPVYVTDLLLRVVPPPGDEIVLGDIRKLIYELGEKGYIITTVTMDQYQCLSKGTRINTSRGILPIEEVKKGDLVQSRVGPRSVRNTFSFGEQPTKVLRLKGGTSIEGTDKHRIEVQCGWDYSGPLPEPKWEWKRFDEIEVGDVVHHIDYPCEVQGPYQPLKGLQEDYVGSNKGSFGSGVLANWEFPNTLTPALAEVLGVVWGDGDIGKDGVRVSCALSEASQAELLLQRFFGNDEIKAAPASEGRKSRVIRISSRPLVRWLEDNDLRKPNIPEAVMRSPRDVQAAFLRGLFSADGSVCPVNSGKVSLSTAHEEVAKAVNLLLRTVFGIQSSIVKSARTGTYKDIGHQYVVAVRGPRSLFADRIGFLYDAKRDLLAAHKSVKGRRHFTRVVAIEGSRSEVFDLEVADDPSYVANGVMSHNSADARQILARKGYKTDVLSVDRTTDPYDNLKMALYEGRLYYYRYPPLLKELRELELHFLGNSSAHRKKRKVDHPQGGCFVGETRIPLLDGSVPTISELEGKEVWVYSSTSEGKIVPGLARGRKTKEVTELLDVVLDSGAVVRCTPDHRWMLRNGEYKEAKDLRPGVDRLMPINRIWPVNGGYERVTDKDGNRTLTHHMVMGSVPEGFCVHHKNHVKTDNRPENLELVLLEDHAREHTSVRHATDSEWRDRLYEGARRFNSSLDGRRKHASAMRRTNARRTSKDRKVSVRKHPGFRSDVTIDKLEALRTDVQVTNANLAAVALGCGRNVVVRVLRDAGYDSWREFRSETGNNHKVRYVIPVTLETPVPVYDLEVDTWSNFALSEGVFVHNSKDVADALAGACYTLSTQQEDLPLPIMNNTNQQGDLWLLEQKQAAAAGHNEAGENRTVKDFELLPPFLTGYGGGGDDWGGGWSPGSL